MPAYVWGKKRWNHQGAYLPDSLSRYIFTSSVSLETAVWLQWSIPTCNLLYLNCRFLCLGVLVVLCFCFCFFFFKLAAYMPSTNEGFTVNLSFTHQAYPCTNDKECEVGRYCHSPHHATSACMMCRRKKKRCHRDGMCCPGNRCNNGTSVISWFYSIKSAFW